MFSNRAVPLDFLQLLGLSESGCCLLLALWFVPVIYHPWYLLFFQELLALQKGRQWVHLLAGALKGLVSVVGKGHLI